jgi:hypothetical protein
VGAARSRKRGSKKHIRTNVISAPGSTSCSAIHRRLTPKVLSEIPKDARAFDRQVISDRRTVAHHGQVVHWIAETQAPISVTPEGWKQQSFKPGDEITITVEPMKTGRPAGRIMLVVLPDGSKLKGQTTFKEDQYARP